MAEERLTLLMRARGGRRAKSDVDDVGHAIGRLGTGMRQGGNEAGFLSRGLRVLQTRFGFMILLGLTLAGTIGPPLVIALALATAAAAALGGAVGAAGLIALGAAQRYKLMSDVV